MKVNIQVIGTVQMQSSMEMEDTPSPEVIAAKSLGLVCLWDPPHIITTDLVQYIICIGRVPDSDKVVICTINKN